MKMNTQRHKLFYSLLVVFGVLFLLIVAIGSAAAKREGVATHFKAIDVACEMFDGDGDLNFKGVVLSEDKRIAGTSFVEISFVGNRVLVDYTLIPEDFDGTWIAPGHSTVAPKAPVIHKGFGTGVFEGQKIMLKARVLDDELDNLLCKPVGPVVELTGKIIE
jgi:hypothetical protein